MFACTVYVYNIRHGNSEFATTELNVNQITIVASTCISATHS